VAPDLSILWICGQVLKKKICKWKINKPIRNPNESSPWQNNKLDRNYKSYARDFQLLLYIDGASYDEYLNVPRFSEMGTAFADLGPARYIETFGPDNDLNTDMSFDVLTVRVTREALKGSGERTKERIVKRPPGHTLHRALLLNCIFDHIDCRHTSAPPIWRPTLTGQCFTIGSEIAEVDWDIYG
jgi:hypothetical protein